jgi:D-3-phosphoglycerate dehydrogenase
MSRFTVLITDRTWPAAEREMAVLAEVDARVIEAPTGAEAELVALAAEADGILTCFAQVTPAVISAAPRLKVIGRYGIGVDNIAVAAASARAIPVTNVPAYCVDEVAEHVIGVMFCLARGLHRYDRAVRAGDWSLTSAAPVHRIAGRTLGIVGFGRIGQAVAGRARGLGLHVLAHAPRAVPGVERVALLELARRADFVSLHVPLTADTEGLIDRDFIDAMKPGAVLINAARGAVVDQAALTEALLAGRIAGAGLDVFVPERLPAGHPLLGLETVLATPHTAFYSEESLADLATLAARGVAAVLAGRRPEHVVNPEVYRSPRHES